MKFSHLPASLLLCGLLLSCQHTSALPEVTERDVAKREASSINQLVADSAVFLKEAPFIKRPFSPYLGDKWIGNAISYGCYREGQAPGGKIASETEILEDLTILSEHWNLFRIYGADDAAERIFKVIRENDLPFKVQLGIWLENETKHPERQAANLQQVNKALALANRYEDLIVAINVGNESQVFWSWHRMEAASLIKYIRAVRANTDLPVTTADDYNFWNKPESHDLAAEIDFIVLHAYALWNGQQLDHAIEWTDSVYQDIRQKHPEMTIALGETGWATVYNPEKTGPGEQGALVKGEVGIMAQETFIRELNEWTDKNQITTFLFEAFDEPWKGGGDQSGPTEIEKNWGVFYEDRSPKASLTNFINDKNTEE